LFSGPAKKEVPHAQQHTRFDVPERHADHPGQSNETHPLKRVGGAAAANEGKIMSSLKEEWRRLPADAPHPLNDASRLLAAALLVTASHALARFASALVPIARPLAPSDPRLEFHAEAGAPEGALYVDGKLFGRLPGVSRL
jgi:hypothetical protein